MILNEQSKNELRQQILKSLEKLPKGKKLELPLDLLDDLIFLKIKDKKGVTVKFPIWTGDFLRKIDLSNLSFENVFFTHILSNDLGQFNLGDLSKFEFIDGELKIPICNMCYDYEIDYFIDFSYTNINIDFSKLYSSKITRTNFEGVNLSSSNFESLIGGSLEYCNFSNTKINNLPNTDNIFDCNFSLNNLRSVEFDLTTCLNKKKPNIFRCTGANLKCDLKLLNFVTEDLDFNIYRNIYKGFFDECFVNGIPYGYTYNFPKKKKSINNIFFNDVELSQMEELPQKIMK